jgi:predicted 2-oxoglutarate/Fe(II)-dependent dioxygenase YbiX
MRVTQIEGTKPLWQLDEFLNREECDGLIAKAHGTQTSVDTGNKAWHPADTGGGYLRVVMWDHALAAQLWERVQTVLPARHGNYNLLCLNPCFRFSRYNEGGNFPLHCDGKNYHNGDDGVSMESLFTLNIFLNDDFKGGETDFFSKRGGKGVLRHRVMPKTGRAALFWSDQPHRGNTVTCPYKYLLRTDVMGVRR